MRTKTRIIAEFGDFQTPAKLATLVCQLLATHGIVPQSVVEPTCGIGRFLFAAMEQFPSVRKAIGIEINADYVARANESLSDRQYQDRVTLRCESLFQTDLPKLASELPEPILVIGNPPWVTNAHLGSLGSANLPAKANFQNRGGLDALTGKSNFDISEWMLIKLIEALQGRRAFVAMLVKTAVARKVLLHAWKTALRVSDASIHSIDAASHFNAAVDACLLTFRTDGEPAHQAHVYDDLAAIGHRSVMAYSDSVLLANLDDYLDLKHLAAADPLKWRSGIKHDCSKVMELTRIGDRFINGLGDGVRIEDSLLFPMLKSSDVANGTVTPTRWMIVPQRTVGEDTQILAQSAPRTWAYLSAHRDYLDRRGSTIYRGRPPFSIFGVGEYSFASWKVAISGFYKRLSFTTIGPAHGKPVMLDDTCYFLPCDSADEARALESVLNSAKAKKFFESFIFWDAKRPITADLLGKLDLHALSMELGMPAKLSSLVTSKRRKRPVTRKRPSNSAPTELELF